MIDALIAALIAFELLVLLGVWVALPLLPAILIYRLFPNTQVAASGPLAGLTVKASGAFAGYLIVFVFIFPLVNMTGDAIGSGVRPFWEITGEVKLIDQDQEIQNMALLEKMDLRTKPQVLGHSGEILSLKLPQDVRGKLPRVHVVIPKWGEHSIDLDRQPYFSQWANRNRFLKTIDIGEIKITRVPAKFVNQSQSPMDTGLFVNESQTSMDAGL
jgi:hypothetical protein